MSQVQGLDESSVTLVLLGLMLKLNNSLLLVKIPLPKAVGLGDCVMPSVTQIIDFLIVAWSRINIL
jgi:hypothetical protein